MYSDCQDRKTKVCQDLNNFASRTGPAVCRRTLGCCLDPFRQCLSNGESIESLFKSVQRCSRYSSELLEYFKLWRCWEEPLDLAALQF